MVHTPPLGWDPLTCVLSFSFPWETRFQTNKGIQVKEKECVNMAWVRKGNTRLTPGWPKHANLLQKSPRPAGDRTRPDLHFLRPAESGNCSLMLQMSPVCYTLSDSPEKNKPLHPPLPFRHWALVSIITVGNCVVSNQLTHLSPADDGHLHNTDHLVGPLCLMAEKCPVH